MVDPRPLRLDEGEVISSTSPQGESVYFEVTRELGSGGSGIVYECFSDEGTAAVIKGPRVIGGQDPALEREERGLREVPPHPNLIRLLGSHRDPRGHILIILERVFENPLVSLNREQVLARLAGRPTPGGRFTPLPPSTALELAYELACALDHLHQNKLAHCDVKPQNLLLRLDWAEAEIPDHDYFTAVAKGQFRGVLIDLGGARSFRQLRDATAGVHGVSLPALTPIYAPPEVLPGEYDPEAGHERSRFTPWIDTYAFGLTLYQLLTGWVPYDHLQEPPDPQDLRSVAETKREERDGAHRPIARQPLDRIDWDEVRLEPDARGKYASRELITERLWHLLASCVYYDPRKRPTMKRLRGDLADLLGVEPAERQGPASRDWAQRRFVLNAFGGRLTEAAKDGTRSGKAKIENIRRGGSDFWEMQGFRPS